MFTIPVSQLQRETGCGSFETYDITKQGDK